jgi:hypothetical protein
MDNQVKYKSILDKIKLLYAEFKIKINKINNQQLNIHKNIEIRNRKNNIQAIRDKIKNA